MTLIDAPAVGDLPTLTVPHGPFCSSKKHGWRRSCMREATLENYVEEELLTRYPRLTVQRQPYWGSVGRPDLVTMGRVGPVVALTILELKHDLVNESALRQLARYVEASRDLVDTIGAPTIVTGVLVGFAFRPMSLPDWATRWRVQVEN